MARYCYEAYHMSNFEAPVAPTTSIIQFIHYDDNDDGGSSELVGCEQYTGL